MSEGEPDIEEAGPAPSQTDDEVRTAVITALQQWGQQGNPIAAAQGLQPIAVTTHHPVATALTAWLYIQNGQAAQALPFIDEAVETGLGTGQIVANFLNWAAQDANQRPRVAALQRAAVESGAQTDPFGLAQLLVNQGDGDAAWRLLLASRKQSPDTARREWIELMTEAQSGRGKIEANVEVSEQARVAAVEAIQGHERQISEEAERVRQLVQDATVLIQGAGAHQLATEYAARADAARRAATRWTIATLLVGAAAICLGAAFVLVGVHQQHDAADILTKAGVSLPLLGVAAYLNKLAGEERRDGRTWRHVELQIRTAQPYLANLPEAKRDDVQAALALRFFPGQSQNPHGGGADPEPDDAIAFVRGLQQQRDSGT